jgi:aspartate carbamoyltransferase catalytic subunit
MKIRTRASFGIAAALGALVVAVAAQGSTDEKVLVCHGTASATNNLVLIEVSQSALNGHFDVEDGVVVGAGHGAQNAPDQWSALDGTGFSGDCRDLYVAEYGSGGEE